jgi:hypothetical protein
MAIDMRAIDRAILDLHHRKGRFTGAELREQLGVAPEGPDAKNIANRVHRLYKRLGILRTDGIGKRNMEYSIKDGKLKAFEARLGGTAPAAPAGAEEAPIRKLARLADLDELRGTVMTMARQLERVEKLVGELHSGLFTPPAR